MLPNSALHARVSATASQSAEQYLLASHFVGRPCSTHLRKLTSRDVQWLPALADLLIDGVHHGASLGFLAPLSRYQALDYWQGVLAHLGARQSLWIACESGHGGDGHQAGPLQGAVQLSLCSRANAHHRGEVERLMVHSHSRGRGIASQLMSRVECAALEQGRSLLVLEAPAGSQAEAVYAHLGWQRAGEIPDYHACAEGRLHGSAMYYKRLTPLR
ncbi:MAG: GNAT family N-acetyltransferase [Microbacteriaceae bacterium]|nr:GNAT family N-acetyltransferase [Burkholderiaceae bacterium]